MRTNFNDSEGRAGKIINGTYDCCKAEIGINILMSEDEIEQIPGDTGEDCILRSCVITCTDIHDDNLIPLISSVSIEESDCSEIDLKLIRCKFHDGKIKEKWLSESHLPVENLEIIESNIQDILPYAFDSDVFKNTRSLSINNEMNETSESTLILYNANIFEGLSSLTSLTIQNVPSINIADKYLLEMLTETLSTLTIRRIPNYWAPTQLFSIVELNAISTVDLRNNNFPTINSSSFAGIKKKTTDLNLSNSKIESITFDACNGFEKLSKLQLNSNRLTSIAPGTFDNLLKNPGFTVTLQNNLWHCDCQLRDLQEKMLEFPNAFTDSPKCSTPEDLNGYEITSVDLCPQTTDYQEYSPSGATKDCSNPGLQNTKHCTTTTIVTTDSTTVPTSPATTTESTSTPTTSSTSTPTITESTSTPTITESTSTPTTTTPEATSNTTPNTTIMATTPHKQTTYSQSTNIPYSFQVHCSPSITPLLKASVIQYAASNRNHYDNYDTLTLMRPTEIFHFEMRSETEVQVIFASNNPPSYLIYYPSLLDISALSNDEIQEFISCQIIVSQKITVNQLDLSTMYTFCAFRETIGILNNLFGCKSYQTSTPYNRQTWLYQEQKVIILTSFMMLLLLSLVVGIIMTFFLLRRMPTLLRGSKRVVIVNNRTKDVMILPSGSRSNSWQRESVTPVKTEAEPPTYLTPLPRKSHENKPPFMRSSSDSSLRSALSYVSVTRAPPRFSQVFQASDFQQELPRRCGSFPHCHGAPSCHSPELIPPPLPRRSIASSTASTVEIGKRNNNSIYRRQPSRIEDETENHYNFII
ncbi:CLUMA_CG019132, isoform A [Clunio marinus]|uniref:CLUMA_CG019132, isoform A n=1 Tax=Clunio marinus TaxID=568069 RepID=A0A1J1J1V3_9DIPT|nr:CLUMA_CG019132, isoform A [Clunio marinus]